MLKILSIACILSLVSATGNLVCYFESWAVYRNGNGQYNASNVDPHLCTHILYAFVGLQEDGKIAILDDWEAFGLEEIKHLISLKQQASNLKILFSMGGWNEGSTKYSNVAKSPTKRTTMVKDVLKFVQKYGFDGFDLDWEYPNQRGGSYEDRENFVILLRELKTALHAKGLILSAAVAGAGESIDTSYNVPQVSENLDMINIMSYDIHGDFDDYVGHYAPLYPSHLDDSQDLNVASGIKHWIEKGANPQKLNLGVGTYGRTFTLATTNAKLYAPINGPGEAGPYTEERGILGYNEICELHSNWQYVWDNEQKVPHRFHGNQWVGYDNVKSIRIKTEFAKKLGLGGVMVWTLDTDDFRGVCGDRKYPLIREVKAILGNN